MNTRCIFVVAVVLDISNTVAENQRHSILPNLKNSLKFFSSKISDQAKVMSAVLIFAEQECACSNYYYVQMKSIPPFHGPRALS